MPVTTCLVHEFHDDDFHPYPTPPLPERYYGLLTDPIGSYGCMKYGKAIAITLEGSEAFMHKAVNLLGSFGSHTVDFTEARAARRPNTWFVCCPPIQIRKALRAYLFGQLWKAKAVRRELVDSEGDFVEIVIDNEEATMLALSEEASRLADSFITYEISTDYLEGLDTRNRGSEPYSYRLLEPDYQDEDEN